MASSYTTDLRIEKMVNGENSGTWGTKTNTNWDLIEQAIAGVASVAMTDAEYTLSTANAASDEARNAVITMTGTLTGTQNVIVPSVDKCYTIKNSTTGGYSIVVKTAAGTGVTISNGDTVMVYCDATNVLPAQTALGTTLAVAGGGTGRTTSTTAYGLIAAGTTATGAHQTLAAGATTEILVGGGAAALPVWTAATGSGAPVRATSPTLVTPKSSTTIGVGNATPSASGAGVSFPATQSASTDANTLDDYEEGTWTPTLVSTGLTFGYTDQSGTYTKVGRQITLSGYIAIDTKTGSTDNAVTIGGNAFVASGIHAGACIIYNMAGTATVYHVRVSSDSTITLLAAATEVAMTGSKLNSSMGFSFSITFCV